MDVHKQTPGRKRHIVVDTLGLLLLVVMVVRNAGLQDHAGGKLVLHRAGFQDLFNPLEMLVGGVW